MLFLFLIVSIIDVLGIGLIGPFVALIGHQGNIVDEYPIFFSFFGLENNKNIILFVGVVLATVFVMKGFVAYFVQKRILSLGYEIRTSIIDKLVASYQNARYEDIAVKDISSMIVNAKTHVGLFTDSVFVPALRMTIEFIVVIGIFSLMAYTNFLLVVVISLLLTLVLLVYFKLIKTRLYNFGQVMSIKEASVINQLGHVIGAFREIRLLGVENFFRKEIKKDVIKFGEAGVITRSLHLVSRYLIEASLVIFIVAILIYMMNQSQPISQIFSVLSVFAVGSLRLVPSFSAIGLGFANIRTATYALNSLYEEIKEIGNLKKEIEDISRHPSIDFQSLSLENICFSYKGKEEINILKDISLSIDKGDFIALSGKSGAGKSTLMDIMTGMLQPSSGKLLINNQPLNATEGISLKSWQQSCAFIPQSVFLVDSSIRKNIALGLEESDIDQVSLDQAIKGANLQEVLEKNRMDLDSNVGEGGIKLSGGQRQRVALARALYAKRKIIFMDEATSALDKETEDEVMNHIESLQGRVTIILITHSKSALKNCNKIFNLNKGSVI
tara:strand:- start:547 stop:2214 length:1668 start_codon:yes stop_codon:yes gene_type:complete